MAIPAKVVETYRKVMALAERAGTDAEQTQAERTLAAMRVKYPGIGEAAEEAEDADLRKGKHVNDWFTGAPPGKRPGVGEFWDAFTKSFVVLDQFLQRVQASFDLSITAAELCTAIDETGEIEVKTITVKGVPLVRMILEWEADDLDDILNSIGDNEHLRTAVADHVGSEASKMFVEMAKHHARDVATVDG